METHSNKILVSSFVGLLLAALVAFSLWKSAPERSTGRPYDIVGTQSAAGLLVGSPVTFSGVPVGRVTSVELDPARLGAVKIRIDITEDKLQITEGTVARLSSDLVFGKALISLEQPTGSAPVLLARAGEDAPRIPLGGGGMGDMVQDPAATAESIRDATDRLLAATTPEQQRMLAARLDALDRSTAQLAERTPTMGMSVASARQSLRDAAAAAADLRRQAEATRRSLDRRRGAATPQLKSSLTGAQDAIASLNRQLESARAPVQAFSQSAVDTSLKVKQARESVAAVQEPVEQVERSGLGALISGPPTPDYPPKSSR